MTVEWIALYKFGRLALLALILSGIALFLYATPDSQHFETPARRMLEDDLADGEGGSE